MGQSLSWKKKKSNGEASPGIAGITFGILTGLILVAIDDFLLNGMFLYRLYNLIPFFSSLPSYFIYVGYGLVFMVLGLIIDLNSQ